MTITLRKNRIAIPILISLATLLIGSSICLGQVSSDDTSSANNTEVEDEQSLIGKLLEIQAAKWNQQDLEGFMETYWNSKKLTFSSGGTTTRGWQATLDRYKSRYQADGAEMGHLNFDEIEINVVGDDVALVLGRWHLKMKAKNLDGNFSLVLKKMDGNWKIIHDHSSSLEK